MRVRLFVAGYRLRKFRFKGSVLTKNTTIVSVWDTKIGRTCVTRRVRENVTLQGEGNES